MIQINGDPNTPQPSTLLEEILQIQTDNTAIDGSMQRNKINQKLQATLTYEMISPAGYQSLVNYYTSGSGVNYYNNQSDYAGGVFSFAGLPTFTESEYVTGSSLYRAFQVKIRQV